MYNNSNELYHHGVLGMHWGIRRYQPYRKGEKVKGGKEVGEATKVEQRPVSYKKRYKINRKLSKNDDKILKLRSKQYGKSWAYKNMIGNKIMKLRKKNAKLNEKAGYSNTMETDEYRREYERVSSGGVDKKVDAAAKKAYDAQQHEKQHPSMQAYKASVKARNDLLDAQNEYMKKTGIQRYNKDQLTRAVDSYKKATESSKKALNDFESKKFTKEMQDEYSTMRSTDPKYEKYRALKKQLYELNVAYNNDKSREQLWTEELKKLQMAHSSTDSDSLMHHGVLGMHWGVRRYQPYRKGDKVKGGKEIGKATKVEQRPVGERIKKAIASVNKIKKEIHKGNEEKAEYKFKMAQLKAAKKEVKKAQRREKEERIRERIREHREEQRMERQEAEERRERNWQRARDIASDAATIGTMLYGAYQLKKSIQGERGTSGGSSSSGSSPSVTTSSGSAGTRGRLTSYNPNNHGSSSGTSGSTLPTITTSGSGSRSGSSRPRLTSYNPNDHGQQGHTIQLSPTSTVAAATAAAGNSTGRTSSRARQAIQNFINSARSSRQVNRSLDSHSRDRQEALDNNYRRSADRNSQLVSLQNAIAAARSNADDSFNGHRSQSSSDRIRALDSLASRTQSQMNREVGLTANTSAVADQYRRNSTRAGRRQQAASDRVHDIARAAGMSDTQYRNATKKDKLKALAKYLTSNSNSQMDTLNDDLLGRMRGLQSSGNGASQAEINDIRRELERLTARHSLSSRKELYHYGTMTKKRSK